MTTTVKLHKVRNRPDLLVAKVGDHFYTAVGAGATCDLVYRDGWGGSVLVERAVPRERLAAAIIDHEWFVT